MNSNIRLLSTAYLKPSIVEDALRRNVVIDVVPFIETRELGDDTLTEKISSIAQLPANVIFTSAKAVVAVNGMLQGMQPSWNVFCPGGATLSKVQEAFNNVTVIAIADNAADLADQVVARDVKSVIFFCGDIRLPDLPTTLNNAGVALEEVVVYETREVHHKLTASYDAILFYSPSAVKSFFSSGNTIPGATQCHAIGKTTAEELKQYTTNDILISAVPSKESMVSEMIACLERIEKQTHK